MHCASAQMHCGGVWNPPNMHSDLVHPHSIPSAQAPVSSLEGCLYMVRLLWKVMYMCVSVLCTVAAPRCTVLVSGTLPHMHSDLVHPHSTASAQAPVSSLEGCLYMVRLL